MLIGRFAWFVWLAHGFGWNGLVFYLSFGCLGWNVALGIVGFVFFGGFCGDLLNFGLGMWWGEFGVSCQFL